MALRGEPVDGGERGIMQFMPLVEFRDVSYEIAGKPILSE